MNRQQIAQLLVAIAIIAFIAAFAGTRIGISTQPTSGGSGNATTSQEQRIRNLEVEQCKLRQDIANAQAKANGQAFGGVVTCGVR